MSTPSPEFQPIVDELRGLAKLREEMPARRLELYRKARKLYDSGDRTATQEAVGEADGTSGIGVYRALERDRKRKAAANGKR